MDSNGKDFWKKKFENKMIYIFRFVIGLLWIVCIFILRYINDVKKNFVWGSLFWCKYDCCFNRKIFLLELILYLRFLLDVDIKVFSVLY